MIYFLQAGKGGPVKIGFTQKKLRNRIATIQTSCIEELILLGVAEGGSMREKQLHDEFAEYLVRREWFLPHEKLLEKIAAISSTSEEIQSKKIQKTERPSGFPWAALSYRGDRRRLCKKVGITEGRLSQILSGERASAELAIRIHHVTDGEIPASALRPDLWCDPSHVPTKSSQ